MIVDKKNAIQVILGTPFGLWLLSEITWYQASINSYTGGLIRRDFIFYNGLQINKGTFWVITAALIVGYYVHVHRERLKELFFPEK